jgi:formate dehydrogenase subunit beta
MEESEKSVREIARRLLTKGKVDLVIGYEAGTMSLRSTPCFICDPDKADRLIWDPTCDANLSKYLIGQEGMTGVFVKGCDARSAVVCMSEGQVDRDKVVLIGLPCPGVIDRSKIESRMDGRDVTDSAVNEDRIVIRGDGFEEELLTKDFLCDSCINCTHRNPPVYDVMVGEPLEEETEKNEFAEVEELESMTAEERWNHFVEAFSDCIRCYSCRNVCPLCYCKECFVDETMPAWFGKTNDLSDTMIYHIVRSLHMAGRCVDCGACSRACSMGIDLRTLLKKTEKIVKERFGFEAGMDVEETPVMGEFKQEDSEEFVI